MVNGQLSGRTYHPPTYESFWGTDPWVDDKLTKVLSWPQCQVYQAHERYDTVSLFFQCVATGGFLRLCIDRVASPEQLGSKRGNAVDSSIRTYFVIPAMGAYREIA